MSNVKSTDSKQVLDTSHEREILVCSTLDTVTVGALGCSVPSEEKLTKYNTDVKICSPQLLRIFSNMHVSHRGGQRCSVPHKHVAHLSVPHNTGAKFPY